jgi:hypothetical protein
VTEPKKVLLPAKCLRCLRGVSLLMINWPPIIVGSSESDTAGPQGLREGLWTCPFCQARHRGAFPGQIKAVMPESGAESSFQFPKWPDFRA